MPAYLAQIDGRDPVANAAVSVRASSVDDDRVCMLDAANGVWWPAVAKLPALRYDLIDGGFSGRIDTPASSLALVVEPWPNLPRYILADARVRIWEGEPGTAWPGGWTLRFDGRAPAQPAIADGIAQLPIAVDDRWLDTPLLSLYAGTGGAEGEAALKGQPKPLALGAPRFAPGTLIDTVNNVLQLSAYGPIEDVEVAFERLLRFAAPIGDYASYAALVAATIPAGAWATAEAVGMVRHGAPPVPGGRFAYHLKGDKGGPDGWVRLPGAIVKRLALMAGGTGRIDEASLTGLNTARPWTLSLHQREQVTARELIQRIAASVNAVAGVSWLSKLFVAPIGSASGGFPAASLTLRADGTALPPVAAVRQIEIDPPFWRMAIEAERTWDVHALSDVAFSAVLVERGPFSLTETYREGHIVQDQNSTWLYTNPTPTSGNAPPTLPTTSNAYWKVLAKAGDNGAPGAPGADGQDGTDGAPGAPGADGNDGEHGVTATTTGPNPVQAPCSSDGTLKAGALSGTGGTFQLRNAVTSAPLSASNFTVTAVSGCAASINSTTGVYSFTDLTAETASATFRCERAGVAYYLTIRLSKARDGSPAYFVRDDGVVASLTSGTFVFIEQEDMLVQPGVTVSVGGLFAYSCDNLNAAFFVGQCKVTVQNVTDGGAETDVNVGAAGTTATRSQVEDPPGSGDFVDQNVSGSATAGGTFTNSTGAVKQYRLRVYVLRSSGNTAGTGEAIISGAID
jgi:hypothetical protein